MRLGTQGTRAASRSNELEMRESCSGAQWATSPQKWMVAIVATIVFSIPGPVIFSGIAHATIIEQDEEYPPQELEGVTIWGSIDGTAGWGPWVSDGSGTRFSDTQIQSDSPDATLARYSAKTQDARCSSDPTIRNSRSTDDLGDRRNVADKMYQAFQAQGGGLLAIGSRFPVFYSDGGGEIWIINRSLALPTGNNIQPAPQSGSFAPAGTFAPPSAFECSVPA